MAIEEPLWLLLAALSLSIGLALLLAYRRDRDRRKLMFSIGFLLSSISWTHMALAPESISNHLLFWNLYYWFSVPLMLAIFITIFDRLVPGAGFKWLFRVFMFGTLACCILAFIPMDLQPMHKMVSLFIGIIILASSFFLFIRDRNSLDVLYLFAITAFMAGGMAQAREMTGLAIFAFLYGNLLLGFLFLGDVKGRKGTYFSMKKRLEDAEKNLEATRERYKMIVENASNAIILTRKDGLITYVSPTAWSILCIDPDSIMGTDILEVCPDTTGVMKNYYKHTVDSNGQVEFEHDCTSGDCKDKWLLHTIKKLENDGDEVIHVLRDITEIRAVKDSLSLKVKDLEMSERASLNIMEDMNENVEYLKSLEKKLAAKNKELEDYTYTVSHDLKAPLVTIQGFSDLLVRSYGDKLDDKAKHYLDRINQGSERLAKLVSDLLELSRAGRKMNEFKLHDFNEILGQSLDGLEGKITEKNVIIKKPDDFPSIYCDEIRLGQVTSNLIGNAINYMGDEKNPTIQLGWAKNNGMYEFWIQDNGVGIKEEDKERIFNIFERAADSSAEGTGIGLSIVKKVIELHGGEIRVDSEFGKGSKFTFTIPVGEK